VEGARRSSRERVQTPKAVDWSRRRSRALSSDGEDTKARRQWIGVGGGPERCRAMGRIRLK
jgi:hypothetical protein